MGLQGERIEGSDKAYLHSFLDCPLANSQLPLSLETFPEWGVSSS